jgi:type III secretion protein N (ATPase)
MIARSRGHVVRCLGDAIVAVLPAVRVGDEVAIRVPDAAPLRADVTAVARGRVWLSPAGSTHGVGVGDRVERLERPERPATGLALLGRAIDAAGNPLDGGPPLPDYAGASRGGAALGPGERAPVAVPFVTGIAALDALLVVGRGARIGIFGPPGAGKSSLLEALVAGAEADAVVLALVGERGREAERWLGRIDARTSLVCATSDRSAPERVRAAEVAMLQAESLRSRGLHVLLVLDSMARLVAAFRERRAAAREAVGRGGYPPGVWSELARYLERAGNAAAGSITLFATVLSDGSDERDPLSEAARSYLDGHVALSPAHARAGRFPAIDVLASASRTMGDVVDGGHLRNASHVRAALALLAETRDGRNLGLFALPGPALAAAIEAEPAIEALVRSRDRTPFAQTRASLRAVAELLAGPARDGGAHE